MSIQTCPSICGEEVLYNVYVCKIERLIYAFRNLDVEYSKCSKDEFIHDVKMAACSLYKASIINESCCKKVPLQPYYDKLIDIIVWTNRNVCAVKLLSAMLDDIWINKDFARQILNHPKVIDSYTSPHVSLRNATKWSARPHYGRTIAKINDVFTEESALTVLRKTRNKRIFYIFGYHTVISKHTDLQIKWIQIMCDEKFYLDGPFNVSCFQNITDEALENIPLEDAIRLIEIICCNPKHEYLPTQIHITHSVIKKLILTYIIANGKNVYIRNLVSRMRRLPSSWFFKFLKQHPDFYNFLENIA